MLTQCREIVLDAYCVWLLVERERERERERVKVRVRESESKKNLGNEHKAGCLSCHPLSPDPPPPFVCR